MKRLFMMLVTLFVIYFMIQIGFNYFGKGHDVNYNIKSDNVFFEINEKYINNTKGEKDSYHFKIKFKDSEIVFQTYENFSNNEKIIQKIEYFEDEKYKCILPVFVTNKVIFDILCLDNDNLRYYHDIIGESPKLDDFAKKLSHYNLESYYIDNKNNKTINNTITIFDDNILNNHFISFTNYKGLSTINNLNFKKLHNIKLFKNDVYKREVEAFLNQYYIVADYNQEHEYNNIFIVNIMDNKVISIKSHQKISFESYIQGIVDNKIYLVDTKNKRQYKIDVKKEIILEIGNEDTGALVYVGNKFNRVNINEIISKKYLFNDQIEITSDEKYFKINTTNYTNTGYTYFYQKNNKLIDVYRAPNISKNKKTYLFSVDKTNNINYIDDYIYFEDGNLVKYYHDKTGLRTLFKNDEYDFNKNLKFWVYIKK